MDAPERFALAPMSTDIRVMTVIVLVLPALFAVGAVASPPPTSAILAGTLGCMLLVYASVWFLWRPSRFEVSADGLTIVWPLRSRRVDACTLAGVARVSRADFRREFGWGVRIGAGGLWGGFGWLYTRAGLVGLWISRTDDLVLVRVRGGRPLLLTPERPDRFVATLAARVPAG